MSDERLRIVIVDNVRLLREGLRVVLAEIPGVEVVATYQFAEAEKVSDWSDIDWVISDIAHEKLGPDAETAPIIPLFQHIRALHPGPNQKPQLVAVTSNPRAFNSKLMMRRLQEVDPDIGVVWRDVLGERIDQTVNFSDLDAELWKLPQPDGPDAPQPGVTAKTNLNEAIKQGREFLKALGGREGRPDRWAFGERIRIAAETGLKAALTNGMPPENSNAPSVPQLRHLIEAARLDQPDGVQSEADGTHGEPRGWFRRRTH